MADITSPRNLNPARRHRSYPRVVRRARHNSSRADPAPLRSALMSRRPALSLYTLSTFPGARACCFSALR